MTTRVEKIGSATLYCGNCLEIMPKLGVVDRVICDPPFEDHMHAAKRGEKVYGAQKRIRTDGHANPPPVNFASISEIRDEAAQRIVEASEGWALIFCTPEGVAPWRDVLEAAGAKYKRACIWIKPDSAPQFNGQGPAMGAEMFVAAWCGIGHSKWNGGGRRNTFTHLCQPKTRDGRHPTEKPVSLMGELVELFSDPGQTILDPFMGSGTTGVAAIKSGRSFIGIEEDPEWFAVACERLEDAHRQADLFVSIPTRGTQESLRYSSGEGAA